MTHTPGPWNPVPHDNRVDCEGGTIAERIPWTPNTHLIAAAPDMLAALEYILSWTPENWDPEHARDLAKAAITKAKGN
jgi:hypothetical protein